MAADGVAPGDTQVKGATGTAERAVDVTDAPSASPDSGSAPVPETAEGLRVTEDGQDGGGSSAAQDPADAEDPADTEGPADAERTPQAEDPVQAEDPADAQDAEKSPDPEAAAKVTAQEKTPDSGGAADETEGTETETEGTETETEEDSGAVIVSHETPLRPVELTPAEPTAPSGEPPAESGAPTPARPEPRPAPQAHPAPQPQPAPQAHPAPRPQPEPQPQPASQAHPAPQAPPHPAPQHPASQAYPAPQHPAPQAYPAPQVHPAPERQPEPELDPVLVAQYRQAAAGAAADRIVARAAQDVATTTIQLRLDPAQLAAHRQRERRRTLTFLGIFFGVLLMGLAAFTFFQGAWAWPFGDDTPVAQPCPVAPPAGVSPDQVTVRVYNATARKGLAQTVSTSLGKRKFIIEDVANDPLEAEVDQAAIIRHGPSGLPAAQTVAAQISGDVTLEDDGRLSQSVDLVLGTKYKKLVSAKSAAAKLAPAAAAVPSPAGCVPVPAATP